MAREVCDQRRCSLRVSKLEWERLTSAKPLWLLVLAVDDHPLHHLLVIVVKRKTAAEQAVEDDPHRPDVDLCDQKSRP
jgi:hypothetical protein